MPNLDASQQFGDVLDFVDDAGAGKLRQKGLRIHYPNRPLQMFRALFKSSAAAQDVVIGHPAKESRTSQTATFKSLGRLSLFPSFPFHAKAPPSILRVG